MKTQTKPVYNWPVLLIIGFFVSACVTPIQLSRDNWSRPDQTNSKWNTTQNLFLWGLINPFKSIKAHAVCPHDYQSIRISRSFIHVLASVLTLGLYVPVGVTVFCRPHPPPATVVLPTLLDKSDKQDDFKEFEKEETKDTAHPE